MRRTATTAPAPPSEGEKWLRAAVARPGEPEPASDPLTQAAPTPGRMTPGVMPVHPMGSGAERELRAHLARQMALPVGWQSLA
jgi:hypothetical protein